MTGSVKSWAVGTAVACALVLVAGWMLVVSPKRADAADLRTQADQVEGSNRELASEVAVLQKQFAQIETYKSQVAADRIAIPSSDEISDLLRALDTLAASTNMTVMSVTPGAEATPAKSAKPAPKPTASGSSNASPTPTPATSASPAATTAGASAPVDGPVGLVAIPINIDVIGSYQDTLDFTSGLQTKLKRYVLVVTATQKSLQEAAGGQGRPKSAAGDVETAIGAVAWALPSEVAQPVPSASATARLSLPKAPAGRNAFEPREEASGSAS